MKIQCDSLSVDVKIVEQSVPATFPADTFLSALNIPEDVKEGIVYVEVLKLSNESLELRKTITCQGDHGGHEKLNALHKDDFSEEKIDGGVFFTFKISWKDLDDLQKQGKLIISLSTKDDVFPSIVTLEIGYQNQKISVRRIQ